MRKTLSWIWIPMLLLPPAVSTAQQEEKSMLWEVGIGPTYFDNFFEAPDGSPKESVVAATVEAKVTRFTPSRLWKAFAALEHLDYNSNLDTSDKVRVGLQYAGTPHRFDVEAILDNDRPTTTVGDEFDRADGIRFRALYAYRINRDWEVGANGLVGQENFDLRPTKDSDLSAAGAFVRYRGFGSKFSPELGFEVGERDVENPNEDYDQEDLILRLRSVPIPQLYLSFRYRERSREYSIGDPAGSNFNRQDDRTKLSLTGVYTINDRFSVGLYATHQDADSTKESRIFTSQLIATWLTVHF